MQYASPHNRHLQTLRSLWPKEGLSLSRAFTDRPDSESLLEEDIAGKKPSWALALGEQLQALKQGVVDVGLDEKRRPSVSNSCPMEAHLEPPRWTSAKS